MSQNVKPFIDEFGLLDKIAGRDGGDTCHREGVWFSLTGMLGLKKSQKWLEQRELQFQSVMAKIHPAPGVLIRHPDPNRDASDWDRMSRDQLQPVIIACGYWSKTELKKLAWGHLMRGFLFTNNVRQNGANKRSHGTGDYDYSWRFPDVTLFEIWGNFIRAFKAWYLWPLLLITDLELLFGAVKWKYWPKHNIALNQTLSMMQGYDRLSTPWSWIAVKVCPIPYMIDFIKDHLDDFDIKETPNPEDMEFLAEL